MDKLKNTITTLLFYTLWILNTILWMFLILLAIILPYQLRHRFALTWADTSLYLLRIICGIKVEITGKEHLKQSPAILASNHQSTWETLYLPTICRKQIWVLKKELLYVPFFGWAMATLSPIAINRKDGRNAMQQIIKQSAKYIKKGYSIVLFPEGHRYPSHYRPMKFKTGTARLSKALELPIIPIAHNAGLYWPRRGLLKKGTIKIIIGAPINPQNKTTEELHKQMSKWIETTRDAL